MLGLLGKGIKKLFGTKSDKDLKLLYPYVDKINSEFNKLSSISDQELRDKTVSFNEKISANTKKVSDQIKSLKEVFQEDFEYVPDLAKETLGDGYAIPKPFYREIELRLQTFTSIEKRKRFVKKLFSKGQRWQLENNDGIVKAIKFERSLGFRGQDLEVISGLIATRHYLERKLGQKIDWPKSQKPRIESNRNFFQGIKDLINVGSQKDNSNVSLNDAFVEILLSDKEDNGENETSGSWTLL